MLRLRGYALGGLWWVAACGGGAAPEPAASPEQILGAAEGTDFDAGVAAIRDGDHAAALDIFQRVVEAEPGRAQAHFYLGVAHENLGDGAAAGEAYERAVSLDPKLAEAWMNLTAVLLDQGETEASLSAIERGLGEHPSHAGLLHNRALALDALGRREQAIAAYRAALEANPGNLELKYGYAEALAATGAHARAIELLGQLTQSDDVAVLASSARLLGRLEQFDTCITALDKALAQQRSSELYVTRGLCQHGKKDEAAAFADYQRAVQHDPEYAPGHYYAGMHLKTQGKKAEARLALERAVRLAGDAGVGKAARRALDEL